MAGPIAHIYCALALINSGEIQVQDRCSYIRGTSFNDIRYLKVIRREETHDDKVNLEKIKAAPTDFEKGMLVHSLLDRKREQYVMTQKLYDYVPEIAYKTQLLKFYEDLVLYERLQNTPEIAACFKQFDQQEQLFAIPPEKLTKWHFLLQEYVSQKPSEWRISGLMQSIVDNDNQGEKDYN